MRKHAGKAEAVRLVRDSGRPAAQVARDLGIADHLLYRWRAEQRRRNLSASGPYTRVDAHGTGKARAATARKRDTETGAGFLNVRREVQPVSATLACSCSAGVAYPKIFRGR